MPLRRMMAQTFLPVALSRRENPLAPEVISTDPCRVLATAVVLFRLNYFEAAARILIESGLPLKSKAAALVGANCHFELGEFRSALETLSQIGSLESWTDGQFQQLLGHLRLIAGEEAAAVPSLEIAAAAMTHLRRPHQNLSARDNQDYRPTEIDFEAGRLGLLYDGYNYLGQRVTHVGAGQLGAGLYGRALACQKELRQAFPLLSEKLAIFLASHNIDPLELRLLPAEWFTQIGHLGMLDILFRMRQLGWWRGRAVLLVPSDRIANEPLLSLFNEEGLALIAGWNIDADIFAELVSLQRYAGMTFNAFEMPDGEILPWQDAGARLMRIWDEEARLPPLRQALDARSGATVKAMIAGTIKKWGMGENDWHVCLHMRDAAHYSETNGIGQSHRNAAVENYMDAIRHITRRGGWVIRLGGGSVDPLPKMERVVDYALSPDKSPVLDLHLIRQARFFIGTTSGLTNIAVSFGVPCALVNCITTDAQLWSDRVRFILKQVEENGRPITQREFTSTPWRWRMFSAQVLRHHAALAWDNTPDEILEIVKEVGEEAQMIHDGGAPQPDELLAEWRKSLLDEAFYGNARPSRYWLAKHRTALLGTI